MEPQSPLEYQPRDRARGRRDPSRRARRQFGLASVVIAALVPVALVVAGYLLATGAPPSPGLRRRLTVALYAMVIAGGFLGAHGTDSDEEKGPACVGLFANIVMAALATLFLILASNGFFRGRW